MKRILQRVSVLSILTLLAILPLFSQQIDQITAITYNHKAVDFDDYRGSMVSYGDRVFISSVGRIQECQLSPSGELTQIASFEGAFFWDEPLLDTENSILYCFSETYAYNGATLSETISLMKFDLSTTPMTHIATMPILDDSYVLGPYMWGDFIAFIPMEIDDFVKILRMHKDTLLPAEPIVTNISSEEFSLFYIVCMKDNFLYICPENGGAVYLYDINADLLIGESSYQIDFPHPVFTARIADDKLFLTCENYIAVYDIADKANITLLYSVDNELGNRLVYLDAVLYDDHYLIATYLKNPIEPNGNGIHVYDVTDEENPVLAFTEDGIDTDGLNPCLAGDKLLTCMVTHIAIYDISAGFQKSIYGNYLADYHIKDEYVIENSRFSHEIKIYSLIEDTPNVITITLSDAEYNNYKIRDFQIVGNLLYTASFQKQVNFGDYHFNLDIYDITNGAAQRINRLPLPYAFTNYPYPYNIRVIGEYIILSSNDGRHMVYKFIHGELYLGDFFTGEIEYPSGYTSQQYLLAYSTSRQLEFWDVNNPLNVLSATQMPYYSSWLYLTQVDANTIFIYDNYLAYNANFYTVDDQYSISLTHTAEQALITNIYNGIATMFDPSNISNIIFATIENGVPRVIGQENFGLDAVNIYTFPQQHKMVVQSYAGIHVYDIEYTVSESDVVSKPLGAVLHSNYPNPFNPSTTISFEVPSPANVSISVYNVRGQKVRSLASGMYGAGVHSVVWNGCADDGRSVGSGVYFYRMVSGSFSEVKKMLLVK